MSEDKAILQTFFLALIAGFMVAAFTLHPEKRHGTKAIQDTYERFGLLLCNGIFTGIGTVLGRSCYYKLKKWFKNDQRSNNI